MMKLSEMSTDINIVPNFINNLFCRNEKNLRIEANKHMFFTVFPNCESFKLFIHVIIRVFCHTLSIG